MTSLRWHTTSPHGQGSDLPLTAWVCSAEGGRVVGQFKRIHPSETSGAESNPGGTVSRRRRSRSGSRIFRSQCAVTPHRDAEVRQGVTAVDSTGYLARAEGRRLLGGTCSAKPLSVCSIPARR